MTTVELMRMASLEQDLADVQVRIVRLRATRTVAVNRLRGKTGWKLRLCVAELAEVQSQLDAMEMEEIRLVEKLDDLEGGR